MSDETKKPFVSSEDRPEVKLSPDTPISDLRVRDLLTILGAGSTKSPFENKTSLKDFFEQKGFPDVAKDFVKEIKPEKLDKSELKEFKGEKHDKFEKQEKSEKPEIKEIKSEKIERGEGVFEPAIPQPDPRFEQLVQAVAGLTRQVGELVNQVEELKKKAK